MIQHSCPITRLGQGEKGHFFFGYYDKCPWSPDAQRILVHRAAFLDRLPTPEDRVEIGWFREGGAGEFQAIAESGAWNWQQGAQLQWMRHGDGWHIMHNDRRDGAIVAVVRDEQGRELSILPKPVYVVAGHGRTALTLNYGRLTGLRPEYGYAGAVDAFADDPMPSNDGVYRIDPETGRSELLVSVAQVAAHRPNPMGDGRFHYLNHLMFNPSGTRFCFMHRFDRADGIQHSRLFTLDVEGGELRLLFEGMVSHYDWRDDQTLLAWAGRRKLLGGGASGKGSSVMTLARRTLKPVYYALGKPRFLMNRVLGDSYLLIPDEENAATQPFARGELTCDGHCTYSADRRWVVTDGYPDLRNRQPLFLWDIERNCGYEIGRYETPPELDGPLRVDLHPRFNREGTRVCIDSAMGGRRGMYVVDVSSLTQRTA